MTEFFGTDSSWLAHLMHHDNTAGRVIAILMLLMSVGSWAVMVIKGLAMVSEKRQARRFLAQFWSSRNLHQVAEHVSSQECNDPFSRITRAGLKASEQLQHGPTQASLDSSSSDEFLTRSLRRAITHETLRLEAGLTILATISTAAPFVGLLGTVLGIYHALLAIGQTGQATLDKVAGPVGEALIMTAFGLGVALPAVIAYNVFARANRVRIADLDGFAHDIHALLTTGYANAMTNSATRGVA
ncbi:MotA/TolQ/ExbB proton channel family protein [Pseudaeromonas sharmana]|uniref:Biopolymer transport protein ExbB n=1 Tax=Pseudaeromonas sharmana TaxID=328412 RepID=A0ABV8CL95_9GAMM